MIKKNMEWIPRMKSCCFCMSLMTASCLIGHLEAICGVITIVQDVIVLEESSSEEDSTLTYFAFLSDLLLSSIQVVTGVMLIIGVKTGNKVQVHCWILVHIFLFCVVVLSYIMSVVIVPFANDMVNVASFEMYILIYTIRSLVIYGLCIVAVNSYYMERHKVPPVSRDMN